MREARVNDHWRRIRQRDFINNIKDVSFTSVKGLGDGQVIFNGGISAICGANGAGKTTLMNAIKAILLPSSLRDSRAPLLKLGECQLNSNIVVNNEQLNKIVNVTPVDEQADDNTATIWIDFCSVGSELISFYSEMDNIDELIEQHGPREANNEELSDLSYLVGKSYQSALTYEIEYDDDLIRPYFIVQSSDTVYRTETMGLGEISLHYLMWSLCTCPRDSIILIEEPETYLSPRTQKVLLNVFAKYCDKKGLRFIISTHSPAILNTLPPENVVLLVRSGGTVQITPVETQPEYLKALGITAKKFGVIFVEDRAAREFTKVWVSRFAPLLYQQLEIIDVGSVSRIDLQLKTIPRLGDWIKIIGMYDGDERGKIRPNDLIWQYSFLPGNGAPEVLLREIAYRKPDQFSEVIGRDIRVVIQALSATEGTDHHDWVEDFHKELGVSYEQLIHSLFEVWMLEEDLATLAQESFDEFLELISNQ